jgi:hypothetical protein
VQSKIPTSETNPGGQCTHPFPFSFYSIWCESVSINIPKHTSHIQHVLLCDSSGAQIQGQKEIISPNITITQACNVNFRNACSGDRRLSKYFSEVFQTAQRSMVTFSAIFSDPGPTELLIHKMGHSKSHISRKTCKVRDKVERRKIEIDDHVARMGSPVFNKPYMTTLESSCYGEEQFFSSSLTQSLCRPGSQ